MEEQNMDYKIELFQSMEGWDKMCAALEDIDPEKRDAVLMKYVNFICSMLL